jgi:hypothetical protein
MRSLQVLGLCVMFPIAALTGCDDDGAGPDLLTIADFAGSWEATTYRLTHAQVPAITLEVISLGVTLEMDANASGTFTGSAFIPAVLVGQDLDLDFQGAFSLVGQDTVVINFNPEIPPFLTQTRAAFQLAGNVLTMTDQDTTFDFDGDGTEEPAIFEGTLVRN